MLLRLKKQRIRFFFFASWREIKNDFDYDFDLDFDGFLIS